MKRRMLKRRIYSLVALCLCLGLTPPAGATDPAQPLTTLELVRTYPSEDALRAAHPELFPDSNPRPETIIKQEQAIQFIDPETGEVIAQLPRTQDETWTDEAWTPEEKARVSNSENEIPVVTTSTGYEIYGDLLLVTDYEREVYYIDKRIDRWYYTERTLRNVLYNNRGEQLAELAPEIDYLAVAPDSQTFMAFDSEEDGFSSGIYFYDRHGTLLRFYARGIYPWYQYSPNGQYIRFMNELGNDFYIFTTAGDMVLEGDFTEYAGIRNGILHNLFVSDNGEYVLLSVSQVAVLLDRQGQELWQIPARATLKCHIRPSDNLVLLQAHDPEKKRSSLPEDPFVFKAVALDSGRVLDELNNVSDVLFTQDSIYINIGGQYHEYTIR